MLCWTFHMCGRREKPLAKGAVTNLGQVTAAFVTSQLFLHPSVEARTLERVHLNFLFFKPCEIYTPNMELFK